ncbi:hypothetical protein QCA50_019339 [Cerrena zonata]|uniref:Uncharacterized protein n=1 Tax=Cerrena zonata TaxID=2478898 RepID=A0AAW0F9J0_9APHY
MDQLVPTSIWTSRQLLKRMKAINAVNNVLAYVQEIYDPEMVTNIGDLRPWPNIALNPEARYDTGARLHMRQ